MWNIPHAAPDGKTPWVWSVRLEVRYTGMNQVEDKSVIIDHIVAVSDEAALEIAENMYNSCLKAEWPELVEVSASPVCKFNSESHKHYRPNIRAENGRPPYLSDALREMVERLNILDSRYGLDQGRLAGNLANMFPKKNGGKP